MADYKFIRAELFQEILKDFSLDFDEKSLITIIIGWNGTGKSNLFEALVIIFRDLDLKGPADGDRFFETFGPGNLVLFADQLMRLL